MVQRRIHILKNSSLMTLHFTIDEVMSWNSMYSYYFTIGDDFFGDPEVDYDFVGWEDDSKKTLSKVAKIFSSFEYSVAGWIIDLEVEDIFDAKIRESYPACVSGENAAPPAECGGVIGFEEFKKNVTIVKRKKRQNIFDSFAFLKSENTFDPNFFDLKLVNKILLSRRRKVAQKR